MNYHSKEGGFTLIELLVAMGIVGVLAAIAIPQFAGYRVNAFDALAETTLRNVVVAEEAYFTDNEAYAACDQTTCPILLNGLGSLPQGVILDIQLTPHGFTGTSSHPQGSGAVFTWSR